MRLRPLALAFTSALAASPLAWAQPNMPVSPAAIGPSLEALATGAARGMGIATGLKLGDEAILHAGVFADIGYDTNVFYTNDQRASSVLHVLPKLELSNAGRDGSVPADLHYILFATLDWRKYLSDDTKVTQQDALNPSVGGTVHLSPHQAFTITLADTFTRSQQAPFARGNPITRDFNTAALNLKYSPGGGRLNLNLRYTNAIDWYEGQYNNASNMGNEVMLDGGLKFLPRTIAYAQVSQAAITYFNNGAGKINSYPLRTSVGVRGLVTEKVSVNLGVGYNNGFYSSGDSPTGVGIVAEASYTVSVFARAGLGYRHDFANSPFVGQFYNVDAIYGAFQQVIASRFMAYLFGRYENRRFGSGADRTDSYLSGGAAFDYAVVSRFLMLGASYTLNLNRSSNAGIPGGGIDYTKQVLLFRLGLVY